MQFLNKIIHKVRPEKFYTPVEVRLNIPFFSEDAEYERKLLGFHYDKKHMDSRDWRWIGVNNAREFHKFIDIGCGMFCLKMIVMKEFGQEIPVIKLVQRGIEYGAYNKDNFDLGLIYEGFKIFLEQEFGLAATVYKSLTLEDIKEALLGGSYVIASVSREIKKPSDKDKIKKGGHLVLITGFSDKYGTITFHNSDGIKGMSDKNFTIGHEMFKKYFAGRGIIIKNQKPKFKNQNLVTA